MAKINTIYTYQLNNVQTEFNIPFDYLTRKFVKVTLIGKDRKELRVGIEYRFLNNKTIKTSKPWGSNDGYQYIEIRRETSATDTLVDFSDGSILRAGDLTIANLQAMHIAEEARSLAADSISVNDEGNLDARARRIVNVANPVGRLDAVNKAYVDDAKDGAVQARDKALQYRNEALQYRNEAETYKNITVTKASEVESKINKADSLNTQATTNSNKAQEYATSAQQSASAASTAEKSAKASDKSAASSALEAKQYASSIKPETLVEKESITSEIGSSSTLVVSQLGVSKDTVLNVATVEDLKDLQLNEGCVILIRGFQTESDGASHYRIVSRQRTGGGAILNNGLYANILPNKGFVSPRWFGAKADPLADSTDIFREIVRDYTSIDLEGLSYRCDSLLLNNNRFIIKNGNFSGTLVLSQAINAFFEKVNFNVLIGGVLSRTLFLKCNFTDVSLGFHTEKGQSLTSWIKMDRCEIVNLKLKSSKGSKGFCNFNTFSNCLITAPVEFSYTSDGVDMENITFISSDLGGKGDKVFKIGEGSTVGKKTYITMVSCYIDGTKYSTIANTDMRITDLGSYWVDNEGGITSAFSELSTTAIGCNKHNFYPIRTKPLTSTHRVMYPLETSGVGPFLRTLGVFNYDGFSEKISCLIKATTDFPKYTLGFICRYNDGTSTTHYKIVTKDTLSNSYSVFGYELDKSKLSKLTVIEIQGGIPNLGGASGSCTVFSFYTFFGECTLPLIEKDVDQLNTPYYFYKMKEANVVDDYINYVDECRAFVDTSHSKLKGTSYEQIRSQKPEPSARLVSFAEKYGVFL